MLYQHAKFLSSISSNNIPHNSCSKLASFHEGLRSAKKPVGLVKPVFSGLHGFVSTCVVGLEVENPQNQSIMQFFDPLSYTTWPVWKTLVSFHSPWQGLSNENIIDWYWHRSFIDWQNFFHVSFTFYFWVTQKVEEAFWVPRFSFSRL